jgi:signal transduction histidine kinase
MSSSKAQVASEPSRRASILLLDGTGQETNPIESLLRNEGHDVSVSPGLDEVEKQLASGRHTCILVMEGVDYARVSRIVAASGARETSVVVITDGMPRTQEQYDRLSLADDWVHTSRVEAELVHRISSVLARRTRKSSSTDNNSSMPIDSESFSLIVHDLRTPLNVVYLTLLMLRQTAPKNDPQFGQDLMLVEESFRQLQRMLLMLTDYYRLFEPINSLAIQEFSPRRLIDELLEGLTMKDGVKLSPVDVAIDDSCPHVVSLDPIKAKLAITYALTNASSAASGKPIRLAMRGVPGRWLVEVVVPQTPPSTYRAGALSSRSYQRLCGVAAERRGMDLAIATKVSELFGGEARLDQIPNSSTLIVLDWPERLTESSGND